MKISNMGKIHSNKYQWKTKFITDNIRKISNGKLKHALNNYEYLKSFLNFNNEHNIINIKPIKLLSPYNFDIYAKYLYAKIKILNIQNKFIENLYVSHIYAFNHYKEPDKTKNCKKDFINSFNNLINEYKLDQIDFDNLILPISTQKILIDGSHRLSLSLLDGHNINCVEFDTDDLKFDYTFFKKRGLKKKYLDYMALQIKDLLFPSSCIIVSYNTLKEKKEIIKDLYNKYDVYYIKEAKLCLNKINLLLDKDLYDKTNIINNVLFVIIKNNSNIYNYNVISDKNDINILCNLFLNKNTLRFINKNNNMVLTQMITKVKNLDSNNIYKYKNFKKVSDNILEFNPKKIFYIKNICFIKE